MKLVFVVEVIKRNETKLYYFENQRDMKKFYDKVTKLNTTRSSQWLGQYTQARMLFLLEKEEKERDAA